MEQKEHSRPQNPGRNHRCPGGMRNAQASSQSGKELCKTYRKDRTNHNRQSLIYDKPKEWFFQTVIEKTPPLPSISPLVPQTRQPQILGSQTALGSSQPLSHTSPYNPTYKTNPTNGPLNSPFRMRPI